MEQQDFRDRELGNKQTGAFDRSNPLSLDTHQESEILKTVEPGGLAMEYVIAQISMERFFATGRRRPEHGNESY